MHGHISKILDIIIIVHYGSDNKNNSLLLPHPFPLLCGVDVSYETPPVLRALYSDNSLSDNSFLMLSKQLGSLMIVNISIQMLFLYFKVVTAAIDGLSRCLLGLNGPNKIYLILIQLTWERNFETNPDISTHFYAL